METLLLAPARLPSTLYRIDYSHAQTTLDSAKGFIASDPRAPPLAELNYLRLALLSQARWGRVPSPFISTFADERHARNWALARGDVSARMMVIDTTRLPAGQVLRAVDGYQKLGIEVPANTRTEHEYLCLNRIPATAVVEVIRYGELENARELESEACAEQRQHLWNIDHDPHCHYDAELGWYDSDDEAELRNTNDDIIKMIEGDW